MPPMAIVASDWAAMLWTSSNFLAVFNGKVGPMYNVPHQSNVEVIKAYRTAAKTFITQ